MKLLSAEKFLTPPKAIIFDTDNTLYEYEPAHLSAMNAVLRKAVNILGCSRGEFESSYNEARKEIKNRLGAVASSHSRLLYFQLTIEKLTGKSNLFATLDLEQTYWRVFLDSVVLFSGVKEFIVQVHQQGVKVAVVTDLTAQIQFRKLIFFGLDDYFDAMVTSEEAGADKPHYSPFKIALDKLKVSPDLTWMIGDSYNADMVGAKLLNLTTLQKIHAGVSMGDCLSQDATFSEFDELLKFTKKLFK